MCEACEATLQQHRDPDTKVDFARNTPLASYSLQFQPQAARYKLPAIYPFRFFAESGGLLAYGPDVADQYRRAAAYVDRILKGEKPGELPVEQSTRLDLSLNMKTAKALGITVPPTLLARADAVIE